MYAKFGQTTAKVHDVYAKGQSNRDDRSREKCTTYFEQQQKYEQESRQMGNSNSNSVPNNMAGVANAGLNSNSVPNMGNLLNAMTAAGYQGVVNGIMAAQGGGMIPPQQQQSSQQQSQQFIQQNNNSMTNMMSMNPTAVNTTDRYIIPAKQGQGQGRQGTNGNNRGLSGRPQFGDGQHRAACASLSRSPNRLNNSTNVGQQRKIQIQKPQQQQANSQQVLQQQMQFTQVARLILNRKFQ